MKPFSGFNRHGAIERLANAGLRAERGIAEGAVSNSIHLLAGSLGDAWTARGLQAAAGMVLLALAKNDSLDAYLNDCGWELVSACLGAYPGLTSSLSPQTLLDFHNRRRACEPNPLSAAA